MKERGEHYSTLEAIQMKCSVQSPNELSGQLQTTLFAKSRLSTSRSSSVSRSWAVRIAAV